MQFVKIISKSFTIMNCSACLVNCILKCVVYMYFAYRFGGGGGSRGWGGGGGGEVGSWGGGGGGVGGGGGGPVTYNIYNHVYG